MDPLSLPLHRCFIQLADTCDVGPGRLLRSYTNLATGRPTAMVLKCHIRYIGVEEGRMILYVGGCGSVYKNLYDKLGSMMDDRGTGKAIGGGQGWTVSVSRNEYLLRVMVGNGAELFEFNRQWGLELPADDANFEPGMPIDCVIGLHNVLLQHRTVYPGLETWISKWILRAIRVVKYRDMPAGITEQMQPRLLMRAVGSGGETHLLDVLEERFTSVEAEMRRV